VNLVFGITFFWIGAGLLYVAIDKNAVQKAFAGRAASGHGYLYPLYAGLLATFKSGGPH
jgi:hypothetical protein